MYIKIFHFFFLYVCMCRKKIRYIFISLMVLLLSLLQSFMYEITLFFFFFSLPPLTICLCFSFFLTLQHSNYNVFAPIEKKNEEKSIHGQRKKLHLFIICACVTIFICILSVYVSALLDILFMLLYTSGKGETRKQIYITLLNLC